MMPTTLPPRTIPAPTLTIGQSVRVLWLVGRSRWLFRRLEAAQRRLDRYRTDAAGDALLRAAERWLACHEKIGALLRLPAPPAVEEMRAVLRALPASALRIEGERAEGEPQTNYQH